MSGTEAPNAGRTGSMSSTKPRVFEGYPQPPVQTSKILGSTPSVKNIEHVNTASSRRVYTPKILPVLSVSTPVATPPPKVFISNSYSWDYP